MRMKHQYLASMVMLAGWAGFANGQAYLGSPTNGTASCESCSKPTAPPPAVYGDWRGDCKTKLCQSSIGQMAKSMLAPIRLATGNLLPICCVETVCKDDVARMVADGGYSAVEIAAVKIKVDESQAGARRAAVRYLATIDCHYFPEAEMGLIAALRADRNECVRYEAALALGTCRCVTARIADALNVAVMGCETDGNPAEKSERVRAAARLALNRCQSCGIGLPTVAPQMLPPPDWTPPIPSSPPTPMSEPMPIPWHAPMPIQPTFSTPSTTPDYALSSLEYERTRAENISASPRNAPLATGQRTLYHLFVNAAIPRESGRAMPPETLPVQAVTRPASTYPSLGLRPLGSEVSLSMPQGDWNPTR